MQFLGLIGAKRRQILSTYNIMSGYLPIIKLQLEATSGSLSNPELNLAVGAIVDSDEIRRSPIHQDS